MMVTIVAIPIPRNRNSAGTSADFGIGRSNSTSGSSKASPKRLQPIHNPTAMPSTEAMA